MPSLIRIILINSHLPGVVELYLKGHTNICGTNASGKTTLQRLLPVFYGEYPSRVVPATRDSFERWYLPTESSFIIYEYQSMDEQLCQAVLAPASEGRGINYRFINKAFELDDYQRSQANGSTDNKQFTCITMAELRRVLKRSDINHTRLLNTSEYRAIIQNDRSLINIGHNRSDLRIYARQFSLCATGYSLRHIEKLAKAVHSKEGKMETIKSMIAAILEEEGVSPPDYSLNPKEVEDWIRESKLIQGFEAMRPEFNTLEQEHQQLLSCEQQLNGLFQGYERDRSIQWQRLEESKNTLEQISFRQNDLEKSWTELRDEISLELSATKGDIRQEEDELEQIEGQYDTYLKSNIIHAQSNLDQLPGWCDDLANLEEQHKLMLEKHQDIAATYQERLNKINHQLNLTQEKQHTEKDQLETELKTKKQQQNDDMVKFDRQLNERRQDLNDTFNQQQSELKIQQTTLQVHIDSVNYTQDEQQALLIFDKRIETASEEMEHSRNTLESLQQQYSQLHKTLEIADNNLRQTSKQVTESESRVEKLKRLLFPERQSLLEFLRKEHPGWESSLGKVIHPELLHRKDLKPDYSSEKTESLYGLILDLTNIKLPGYAHSEQQHEHNLKQAEEKVQEFVNLQKEAQEKLSRINTEREEINRKITLAITENKNHKNNRLRLVDEKHTRQNEISSALSERKDKARKKLTRLNNELKNLTLEQQIHLDKLVQLSSEDRLEKMAYWQDVTGIIENQIRQIKANIEQRRYKAETNQSACKSWYQKQLKSRGVDENELGKLEQQRDALQKKIAETEQRRSEVLEYNFWYKQSWITRKPKIQQDLTKDKAHKDRLEQQLKAEKKRYTTARTSLKEQQQNAQKSHSEAEEYLNRINMLVKKIKELKLPGEGFSKERIVKKGLSEAIDEPVGEIGERLRQGDELLLNREQLLVEIKTYVEHFDNLIANQSGSSLAETWERSRDECTRLNEQGIGLPDYRKLVLHLQQLLTIMVPQSINALREQGRIFGINLNAYYDVLADIDRRITSQSNRITREVDEDLFLDGVSNSAVRIRSRISELDFWPELKNFVNAFQQWQDQGFSSLPEENYTNSMRRAIDIIGRSALNGGVASLLEIELHLREGNSDLIIRTDRQLNESSSHGMAYLILCKFLLAFTRLLRNKADVTVHWPIDELGTLHHENIKKIFDACGNNNIEILGAFPNPDSEVLGLFANRYIINKQSKKLQIIKPRLDPITEKLRQRHAVAEPSDIIEPSANLEPSAGQEPSASKEPTTDVEAN